MKIIFGLFRFFNYIALSRCFILRCAMKPQNTSPREFEERGWGPLMHFQFLLKLYFHGMGSSIFLCCFLPLVVKCFLKDFDLMRVIVIYFNNRLCIDPFFESLLQEFMQFTWTLPIDDILELVVNHEVSLSSRYIIGSRQRTSHIQIKADASHSLQYGLFNSNQCDPRNIYITQINLLLLIVNIGKIFESDSKFTLQILFIKSYQEQTETLVQVFSTIVRMGSFFDCLSTVSTRQK